MKKIMPLVCLLTALLLTVSGTVAVTKAYSGKKEQADQAMRHNYDLKRRSIRQLYHQVLLFVQAKKYREAEKLLLRINRLLPGDSGAVRMLGKIYFLKGDLAGAVKICRRLAGTDPDDPVVLNNLGTALIASGFYESGIRRLLEAERLSKGARYIQLNLVFAYIAAGRFALAEKYWTAAQRSSDDPLISLLPADAIVSFPADVNRGAAGTVKR